MSETKKKIESDAEKAGASIGQAVKNGAQAVNDFGKGIKKGLEREQ